MTMFGSKTNGGGSGGSRKGNSLNERTTADRQREIVNLLMAEDGSVSKAAILSSVDGHSDHINDAIGLLQSKGAIAVEKDVFGDGNIIVRLKNGGMIDEKR